MEHQQQKPSSKKIFWIAGAAALVIVLAAAGTMGWQYHETPQFCATCHVMQPYLDSWTGTKTTDAGQPMLANLHSVQGIRCLNCHPAEIQQQVSELVSYVKGDFVEPLKQRKFPDSFCERCHPSRSETAKLTTGYVIHTSATKAQLNEANKKLKTNYTVDVTINPHSFGVDTSNMDDPHHAGAPMPECNSCHSAHRDQTITDYCYSCHHTKTLLPCAACHDANSEQ